MHALIAIGHAYQGDITSHFASRSASKGPFSVSKAELAILKLGNPIWHHSPPACCSTEDTKLWRDDDTVLVSKLMKEIAFT